MRLVVLVLDVFVMTLVQGVPNATPQQPIIDSATPTTSAPEHGNEERPLGDDPGHAVVLKLSHSKTPGARQPLVFAIDGDVAPETAVPYKLESNRIEDDDRPILEDSANAGDEVMQDVDNEDEQMIELNKPILLGKLTTPAIRTSTLSESAEQTEMERTVAELNAKLDWYAPSESLTILHHQPVTPRFEQLPEGSGEGPSTSGLTEESEIEGSGEQPLSSSSTVATFASYETLAESAAMSELIQEIPPAPILKPTRPKLCLGNRRNLTDDQIQQIKVEIREMNRMIKYYIERLVTFCLKHDEYSKLYFKCPLWMDRKSMYYTNYMRLKYCNPVGWPVFL